MIMAELLSLGKPVHPKAVGVSGFTQRKAKASQTERIKALFRNEPS